MNSTSHHGFSATGAGSLSPGSKPVTKIRQFSVSSEGLAVGRQISPTRLDLARLVAQTRQMVRNQCRFVALIDQTGTPACAPVWVEFPELSYVVSDAEFEATAIKIAIADGLLKAEQKRSVRAI